jgi:hypothetical protein
MTPPPGTPGFKWRERARRALENYFRRRSLPRVMLGLVLMITGIIGFTVSYGLLHLGLLAMWLRYPLAVVGAYASFLALLRLWVELEQRRFDPRELELDAADDDEERDHRRRAPPARSDDSWLDWLDLPDFFDFDIDGGEGCLVVALLGVVVALVIGILVALVGAPALVAEVFLDAFLVTALYRRLRVAAQEHWLGTAVRKTWKLALSAALLLALAGWVLGLLAPGAVSIGPAVERVLAGSESVRQ